MLVNNIYLIATFKVDNSYVVPHPSVFDRAGRLSVISLCGYVGCRINGYIYYFFLKNFMFRD